jgi:hypothetical protein
MEDQTNAECEGIWKEAIVAKSSNCPDVCLQEVTKPKKTSVPAEIHTETDLYRSTSLLSKDIL